MGEGFAPNKIRPVECKTIFVRISFIIGTNNKNNKSLNLIKYEFGSPIFPQFYNIIVDTLCNHRLSRNSDN